MRKLSDSAIFNQLASNEQLMLSINSINFTRDKIDFRELEEEINSINRRMNYPTKGKILYNVTNNNIALINNPSIVLPKYMNVIGKLHDRKMCPVIALNNNVTFKNGNMEVMPKTLFALLQNATILLELFNNWNRYTMHVELIKNGSISYSRLMGKIFDKIFAINIDDFKSDMVHFFLAKFFLINMCDRAMSETINNIAYSSCFNKSNLELILDQEKKFSSDVYKSIFSLFTNMKSIHGLEGLNIRSFIENYVRMYGESTLLSLDYLPSFFNMIFSSIVNGNLNKEYIIDSVCGKTNNRLFLEFSKLIK